MPSPNSSETPRQEDSSKDLSQNGSRDAEGLGEDAVINVTHSNGRPVEIQRRDSIQEGKQKAKEVMAASGLSRSSPEKKDTVMEKSKTPPAREEGAMNGTFQSRKRSRSGTRITRPSNPPSSELPQRTRQAAEKVLLEQYVNRDLIHSAAMIVDKFEQNRLIRSKVEEIDEYKNHRHERQLNPAAVFGHGYAGYGNGNTNIQSRGPVIIFPVQRKRPGGRKTKELRVPRKDLLTQSDQLDELVPVRLDIEWDKIRLRDTFTWNLHDRVVAPELYAEQLIEDFKLPPEQCGSLVRLVCTSIQEQIQNFHPQIFIDEEALDPHLPYHAYKNDEMRITIKLNITIGQHTLVDQFEWEINNPMNSPEEFARQMTRDLSLSGEFTTAIAHSIREQSQLFTRSLYVTGHPFDGRPVEDQELKAGFLPSPLPSPFRPYQAAKDFTPYLYELNEAELEKTELSLSREERRQKRSVNRRGGPTLPDLKDRRRTIRTLVVSSVLPGAAETLEDSRIFKRTAAASGRGRRPGHGPKDGLDDSDESDSDDSSRDSPAIPAHLLAGTARTRGMRGAATVAQAAMRGTFGRSATPEASIIHQHETRTGGRRFGGKDYREESVDDTATYIIKLRISPEKYRQFMRDQKTRIKPEPLSLTSNSRLSSHRSQSGTPGLGTPAPGSMGPPPTTPGTQQQQLPRQQSSVQQSHQSHGTTPGRPPLHPHGASIGRVDAKAPPGPDHPIVSQRSHYIVRKRCRTRVA